MKDKSWSCYTSLQTILLQSVFHILALLGPCTYYLQLSHFVFMKLNDLNF